LDLSGYKTDLRGKLISEEAKVEIDQYDSQTINFRYPQIFRVESISQSIRLEVGVLAAWTPSVEQIVRPYIFDHYPELTHSTSTTVITNTVERTFWEKATILHHEANRPEHLDMPVGYSRHYYDLFCIAQTEYKAAALQKMELLQKVIIFKVRFYPRAWARYEEAIPGSIKLVPPRFRLESLQKDYERMGDMMFGEAPSFDSIMDSILTLENEINRS